MNENSSVDDVGTAVHCLFIGSGNGDAWAPEERDAVFTVTSRLFKSFTIMDAMGCYMERPVPTLMIRVGSNDVQRVRELAHVLGRLTKQKEVGLETMGRFQSIKI